MGHLMGLLMDHIMDHRMHRVIHLMGTGINNPLTPRIMALQPQIVKVHHIMVLPYHPTQVKRKEGTMVKAMVVMVIRPM